MRRPALARTAQRHRPPPILSRIGPAPLVAYSAARKLRTGYAGSALRVRRSTDDAEADIGFTASGLLDTAALLAHVGAAYVPATGGLVLPGVAGNYGSVPDAANLRITGDLELVAYATLPDWTPAANSALIARMQDNTKRAYWVLVGPSGIIQLYLSSDGSTPVAASSSVATGFTDGTAHWVKATYRASDRRVQFFTAPAQATEPSSWTQLGTDVTHSVASIWNGVSSVEIGTTWSGGSSATTGTIHRTIIRSGIGGTTVLDIDFTRAPRDNVTNTFGADTGQVVTINRSGQSAYVTTLYDQAGSTNAVQATKANQPRIVNAGTIDTYGGRPCPRYRPAAETHHLDATISVADATFSAVAVVASATTGSNALGRLLSLGAAAADDSSGTASWALFTKTSASLSTTKDSTNDTMSVTADTAVVVSTVADGTNQTTKRNGTNSALSPYAKATSFTISKLVLGSKVTDGTVPAAGGVGDVLIFADALADVDRLAVERDLGAFYGVTVQ